MVVQCRLVPLVRQRDVIFRHLCRSLQLWFNFASTLTQRPRRYALSAQIQLKPHKPGSQQVQTGWDIKTRATADTVWWYYGGCCCWY